MCFLVLSYESTHSFQILILSSKDKSMLLSLRKIFVKIFVSFLCVYITWNNFFLKSHLIFLLSLYCLHYISVRVMLQSFHLCLRRHDTTKFVKSNLNEMYRNFEYFLYKETSYLIGMQFDFEIMFIFIELYKWYLSNFNDPWKLSFFWMNEIYKFIYTSKLI